MKKQKTVLAAVCTMLMTLALLCTTGCGSPTGSDTDGDNSGENAIPLISDISVSVGIHHFTLKWKDSSYSKLYTLYENREVINTSMGYMVGTTISDSNDTIIWSSSLLFITYYHSASSLKNGEVKLNKLSQSGTVSVVHMF